MKTFPGLLLFFLPLFCGNSALLAEGAPGNDSAEARAKICWLWEHFREFPPTEEKLQEWEQLYPQLDREDLEACDETGDKVLKELRAADPERGARLIAALDRAREKRRESLRSRAVTLEESSESRAKICYLFGFFQKNPVPPGKTFSLQELYGRMLESDRLAVDLWVEKAIAEVRAADAPKAGEMAAIFSGMRNAGKK